MIVTWTVEGVNWSQQLRGSVDASPSEIATKGLEKTIDNLAEDGELEFGAIIRVYHDKMTSEDEHIIIFTPSILANAGMYDEAESLNDLAIRELLK